MIPLTLVPEPTSGGVVVSSPKEELAHLHRFEFLAAVGVAASAAVSPSTAVGLPLPLLSTVVLGAIVLRVVLVLADPTLDRLACVPAVLEDPNLFFVGGPS